MASLYVLRNRSGHVIGAFVAGDGTGGDRLAHMLPAICAMARCEATLEENASMAVFPESMQARFEEWSC